MFMDTERFMDTVYKGNDKEDAQPPRVRRTKQASPPDLQNVLLCFVFTKTPHLFNIVHEQKRYERKRDGILRGGEGIILWETLGNF